MSDIRIFLSFDRDHDADLRDLLSSGKIRAAFAGHPDVVHGYALGGEAHDAETRQAGLDAAKERLESLA